MIRPVRAAARLSAPLAAMTLAAFTLAAGAARAASWDCVGQASLSKSESLLFTLVVDDAGAPSEASAYLEVTNNGYAPLLNVDYAVTPDSSRLGAVAFVSVGLVAPYPAPAAMTARARLTVGEIVFDRPWNLYGQWRTGLEQGQVKTEGLQGFFGVVPFQDAKAAVEAAGPARTPITVEAVGDDGAVINRAVFTLPDRKVQQRAADKAFAAARKDAAQPAAQCKPHKAAS